MVKDLRDSRAQKKNVSEYQHEKDNTKKKSSGISHLSAAARAESLLSQVINEATVAD